LPIGSVALYVVPFTNMLTIRTSVIVGVLYAVTGDCDVWLPIDNVQPMLKPAPADVEQLITLCATTTMQFTAGNNASAPFAPYANELFVDP